MDRINRREFLRLSALAGLSPVLSRHGLAELSQNDVVNVAIIGIGNQGQVHLNHLLTQIQGVRVQAVCDIWGRGRQIGERLCRLYQHPGRAYKDYREMLDGESGLDAVLITVPDFVHHEITIASLDAGLHVYCEKEMSNDIEKARSMVQAARRSGKLLQIGHQRRSSPAYLYAHELVHGHGLIGLIDAVSGRWHQEVQILPPPKRLMQKYRIEPAVLEKYGYGSFAEFYNWRQFRKYCGGPMADLGTHQVDVFDWFLDAVPVSVQATGRTDYFERLAKEHQAGYVPNNFDQVQASYEWSTGRDTVKGDYRVDQRSAKGGIFENMVGLQASMRFSEAEPELRMRPRNAAPAPGPFFHNADEQAIAFNAEQLRKILCDGCGLRGTALDPSAQGQGAATDVNSVAFFTEAQIVWAESMRRPPHVYHLENFFAAIRDKNIPLTCPGERGFETCVLTLKTDEAARTGKPIHFEPSDFVA